MSPSASDFQTSPPDSRSTLPQPDDRDRLVEAHHAWLVSGDYSRAKSILLTVSAHAKTRPMFRARASLQLAELAELAGDRREALSYLEHAKSVVGPTHPLALEAEDRRARILTATPLADVRGPVPGSIILRAESIAVSAQFRRAETLLVRYHRVVVAPRLEDMNDVLRLKRRFLAIAVKAYQKVIALGGEEARAAAYFRLGEMHHHLAEALAFAIPAELLPSLARRLRRRFQAESASYLRRSLAYYQSSAKIKGLGTEPWRQLAAREAKTLALVLKSSGRKRIR